VRFWDTSAIVPLLVSQQQSEAVREAFATDPEIIAWWATGLECTSALARLEREGRLTAQGWSEASERLSALGASWQEILPSARLRQLAGRLLRTHPLRTADALQLAAALTASDDDPGAITLVTFDDRLADAARREGMPVLLPA
jgi:uncharacterized protein